MDPMNTINNRRKQAGLPPYPPGGGAAEELGQSLRHGGSDYQVLSQQIQGFHVAPDVYLTPAQIEQRKAELEFIERWIRVEGTDSALRVIRRRKEDLDSIYTRKRDAAELERRNADYFGKRLDLVEIRASVDELLAVGQKLLVQLDRR